MLARRAFLTAASIAPLACLPRMRAARYDLVIKGGRVVDPSQRVEWEKGDKLHIIPLNVRQRWRSSA
jgi:hypothetical protein